MHIVDSEGYSLPSLARVLFGQEKRVEQVRSNTHRVTREDQIGFRFHVLVYRFLCILSLALDLNGIRTES